MSFGRRATSRQSIEPGKLQAQGGIVRDSWPDGLLARHNFRVDLEIVWALMERRVDQLHEAVARLVAGLDPPG
jgi:hypothetical protein